MGIQLIVCDPKGKDKVIDLCDSDRELRKITVKDLKDIISKELNITESFRIIFRTTPLAETSLLISYGIKHASIVNTVLTVHGGF